MGDCNSPWDTRLPWRVWDHAQSGLTAKRPGTGGLGWIRQLISNLSQSKRSQRHINCSQEGAKEAEKGRWGNQQGLHQKNNIIQTAWISALPLAGEALGGWDPGGPWDGAPVLAPRCLQGGCPFLPGWGRSCFLHSSLVSDVSAFSYHPVLKIYHSRLAASSVLHPLELLPGQSHTEAVAGPALIWGMKEWMGFTSAEF